MKNEYNLQEIYLMRENRGAPQADCSKLHTRSEEVRQREVPVGSIDACAHAQGGIQV